MKRVLAIVFVLLAVMVAVVLYYSTDCVRLVGGIKREAAKANYCSVDEDCTIRFLGCPFGCGDYVNKNADFTRLDSLMQSFSKCPRCMYGCVKPPEPVCLNGKCVPVRCERDREMEYPQCECPDGLHLFHYYNQSTSKWMYRCVPETCEPNIRYRLRECECPGNTRYFESNDRSEYYFLCRDAESAGKPIMEEEAVEIAGKTGEALEFKRLYPNAEVKVDRFEEEYCGYISKVAGVDRTVTCNRADDVKEKGWVITYYVGDTWQYSHSQAVRIAVNEEGYTPDIHPKLEYITNRTYCIVDGDCACYGTIPDGRCCGCINYLHQTRLEMDGVKCERTRMDCRCRNDTCTLVQHG